MAWRYFPCVCAALACSRLSSPCSGPRLPWPTAARMETDRSFLVERGREADRVRSRAHLRPHRPRHDHRRRRLQARRPRRASVRQRCEAQARGGQRRLQRLRHALHLPGRQVLADARRCGDRHLCRRHGLVQGRGRDSRTTAPSRSTATRPSRSTRPSRPSPTAGRATASALSGPSPATERMAATAPTILVVEDESSSRASCAYLEKAGYAVDRAVTGAEGRRGRQHQPALIVLDLMLPGHGRASRSASTSAQTSDVPILMLTARDDDVDKIVGLEVGADDYLTKPFNPRELVARIRSILRRATAPSAAPRGRGDHARRPRDRRRPPRGARRRRARSSSRRRSSTCSGSCSTTAASCSRATSCSSASGATRSPATRARSTCTCASCGARSATTCPIVTVWGVGYKVSPAALRIRHGLDA